MKQNVAKRRSGRSTEQPSTPPQSEWVVILPKETFGYVTVGGAGYRGVRFIARDRVLTVEGARQEDDDAVRYGGSIRIFEMEGALAVPTDAPPERLGILASVLSGVVGADGWCWLPGNTWTPEGENLETLWSRYAAKRFRNYFHSHAPSSCLPPDLHLPSLGDWLKFFRLWLHDLAEGRVDFRRELQGVANHALTTPQELESSLSCHGFWNSEPPEWTFKVTHIADLHAGRIGMISSFGFETLTPPDEANLRQILVAEESHQILSATQTTLEQTRPEKIVRRVREATKLTPKQRERNRQIDKTNKAILDIQRRVNTSDGASYGGRKSHMSSEAEKLAKRIVAGHPPWLIGRKCLKRVDNVSIVKNLLFLLAEDESGEEFFTTLEKKKAVCSKTVNNWSGQLQEDKDFRQEVADFIDEYRANPIGSEAYHSSDRIEDSRPED